MTNPAEGYEGFMVPTLFRPWATRLSEAADPRPGERVLDVGCGTGIVARTVAAHLQSSAAITGIDISPDMLAVARAAAAREGVTIDWREGSAERLPFPPSSFDLVLCQFAIMFFTDQRAALEEMRRVAAAGGRVLVSAWQGLDRHPFYRALHQILERRFGMSAVQEIFSLGSVDRLRQLFRSAGFVDLEIEPVSMTSDFPNPAGFLTGEIEVDTASIPSMQRLDTEARQAIVAAIAEEMRSPLAAVTRGDHVILDFHANIVRAWPS
jgi:ubiquinone/menaquinone biosynthesis C-methylase UbiE